MTAIAETLKAADPDRYYATLILPEAVRPHVQALYAFNAEVASVRERVREPAPGEIRLQWWVDALKGEGHGSVRQNPVAAALLDAVAAYDLPTGPLLRLIAARRFDLYDDAMPDVPSFEGYAGETASVLFQLSAMMLNGGGEIETGDAAGHLGVAQAMIGHLRGFGLNASRGRLFLPLSVFSANGVRESEIFSGTDSEGLQAALTQLIDMASEHLGKADAAIAALPKALRPAFAAAALQRTYLCRIDRGQAGPFAPPTEIAAWRKILALVSWSVRNA